MIYRNNIEPKGKVITFYSYKGGVGRSMALVNIACLMAKQKKSVLLVDWDLEAPGLHAFFFHAVDKNTPGLVDFITDVIDASRSDCTNNDEEFSLYLSDNMHRYIQKDIQIEKSEYQLDLMKAGKFDDDYSTKLNAIDWMGFYKNFPAFFRTFAEHLESQYDYILVDSRTGLSDTGGICTMLMPQILVLVFALNNQNLKGVLDVARQSVNYRFNSNDFRDLVVLPLPSRIDDQNSVELATWMKQYTESFQDLFTELYMLDKCLLENYFNIAKIPYKPAHAYGEKIPVLTEKMNNDSFLSYHYAQFYTLILNEEPIYEILSSEEIEVNRKQASAHFQKGVEYFFANNFEASVLEFTKTCELDKINDAAFNNWGNALGDLAKIKEGEGAEALYQQAIEKYQKAVEIKPDYHEAFNNWGLTLWDLAKIKEGEEAEALYQLAIKKYQKTVEIKPDNYEAFNNWGNALGDLAKIKEGEEAEALYQLAIKKYQKTVEIKPDNYEAFNNWGLTLSDLAKTKAGQEAEALFRQAIEKYQKAVEIKLDDHEAFNNWGDALCYLAKTKEGEEAEELYQQAIEKYQKAVEIKPDYHEAFNNWGLTLWDLAKIKEGEEAEALYQHAILKYQKTVEIKPDYYEAFNNWGNALGSLAKTNAGQEAEDLYQQAMKKFQKAVEIKPDFHEVFNNWGYALVNLAPKVV
jgi:tetratricopeptide (TPR) repeat protein